MNEGETAYVCGKTEVVLKCRNSPRLVEIHFGHMVQYYIEKNKKLQYSRTFWHNLAQFLSLISSWGYKENILNKAQSLF